MLIILHDKKTLAVTIQISTVEIINNTTHTSRQPDTIPPFSRASRAAYRPADTKNCIVRRGEHFWNNFNGSDGKEAWQLFSIEKGW